ncbi:MAG TPA: hypothetical protein VK969_01210 [Acidimicrobiia bacterium]|nr:hypothetical protein [Acidimicrobiia bacterium]
MTDWRAKPGAAADVIMVFLVVQLAIPIDRLFPSDTPNRWAWQMFSRAPHSVQFVLHTPTDEIPVDVRQYMARARGDIDLTTSMPPHLCSVHADAIKITWDSGELEC